MQLEGCCNISLTETDEQKKPKKPDSKTDSQEKAQVDFDSSKIETIIFSHIHYSIFEMIYSGPR